MTLTHVAIVVFAALFLAVLSVFLIAEERLSRRNRRLRRRMRVILEGIPEDKDPDYVILRDQSFSHIPFFDRILSRLRLAQYLQRQIDQAGIPLKAGAVILAMLSLGGLVWLLVEAYLAPAYVAPIPGVLMGILPYAWIKRKRQKRINRFEELLPEAIDLVVNALRSGFSLEAALGLVGQEIPDPLGTEFAVTFEEQNLGVDLLTALRDMNHRVPSDELQIITTALSIQKRTGGNLTEILGKIADMVRERLQLRQEIKIFTAQGRFSGFILAVLPIVMAVMLYIISPNYITMLFADPAGQYLLGGAVMLQILGFVVIRRIVKLRF
jgi:tight adherence protein B